MTISLTMASAKQAQSEADKPPFPDMVWIPGGTFLMGSDKHYPEEAPCHLGFRCIVRTSKQEATLNKTTYLRVLPPEE